jgi:hypothetical protein
LTEVGAKLEIAEDGLRPDHFIASHPVGSSLIAGALGLILGATSKNRTVGPIIIAALLGFALYKRSSDPGCESDVGQKSSDA